MNKNEIPAREHVSPENTWNLKKLYNSPEEWEEGLKVFESMIPKLETYKGTLGSSAGRLREFLEYMNEAEMLGERLGYYAHLRTSEDAGNSSHQDRFSRYLRGATMMGAASSFLTPEIQAIPEEKMERFLKDEQLGGFVIALRKILRFKPHILSHNEERLIALQEEARQTPGKTFTALTDVDFAFGDVETPEGPRPLSQSTFSQFLIHPDRTVREAAYKKFYDVFLSHKNSLAALYEGNVHQDIYLSRIRNHENSRAMALFPDKVPGEVYDNLIAAVRENLPLLHNYYEFRRKTLGLDTLRHWDVYVPLVKEVKTHYTYEQAVEEIIQALKPLGEEYCSVLREGLLGDWVDRYENKGKRSGAFSAGSYTGDPYILMNYKDELLRDLFTLAHEGGHSMHSWYSVKSNPFQHYSYTIFEAEVASTFNEQLVAKHLLDKTSKKEMRAYIIGKQVDDIIATVFRQTMFAEFEHKAHTMAESGTPLTVDAIRGCYRELLTDYFGPAMELESESDMEALRIPHFYRAFYVYKYATGLSAAVALSKKVLGGDETDRIQYLNFLKSGGSKYPLESLKEAGVDMSSPQPVRDALSVFGQLLEELKRLLAE